MQAEPGPGLLESDDDGLSEDDGPELMPPRRASAAAASVAPTLDGHQPRKRKGKTTRWNIPKHALARLEKVFIEDKFPSVDTRKNLAAELKVRPRQVQVWFQNKRQRSTKPPVKAGGAVKDLQMLSTSVRAPRPAARSCARKRVRALRGLVAPAAARAPRATLLEQETDAPPHARRRTTSRRP